MLSCYQDSSEQGMNVGNHFSRSFDRVQEVSVTLNSSCWDQMSQKISQLQEEENIDDF